MSLLLSPSISTCVGTLAPSVVAAVGLASAGSKGFSSAAAPVARTFAAAHPHAPARDDAPAAANMSTAAAAAAPPRKPGLLANNQRSTLLRAALGSSTGGAATVAAAWGASSSLGRSPFGAAAAAVRGLSSGPAMSPDMILDAVRDAVQRKVKDTAVLAPLATAAAEAADAGALKPAAIRELCTAFANAGYFDVVFKSAMAKAVLAQLSSFEPAALADVLAAYGTAEYYDFELMAAATAYVREKAHRFDAPALAKVLWAFGRCGYNDDTLLALMHDVAEKLAASCDGCSESEALAPLAAQLADVVYAEAQMGWADNRLADLVAGWAGANIGRFDGGSLARLLAGLATVGYDDPELARAAGARAADLLARREMTATQLAPLLWALGLQGRYVPELMERAEQLLEDADAVASLSPDDLGVIIDAFNSLGSHGPGVAAAAARLSRLVPTIGDAAAAAAGGGSSGGGRRA